MAEEQGVATQAPPPPAPPAAPPATGVQAPPPAPGGHRGGGGAIWFGVVLLLVGIGVLMGRIAPGLDLWGFWPASLAGLLFIIFGIRGMFWPPPADDTRLNKVVEGLTGISVGVILLANSVGALSWSLWWSVLSLWPVLLVSAGLDLIGKGLRASWIRVFSSAVVLCALWYGAFVLPATSSHWTWFSTGSAQAEPFAFSKPSDPDVRTGEAYIEGPVGAMTIMDGSDLVKASGRSTFGEPTLTTSVSGSKASVEIRSEQGGTVLFGMGDPRIDVELDRDVVWDLTLDSGVSELKASLEDLRLSGLHVKTGVSDAEIELGDRPDGDVEVTFDSGVSQVTIRVPEGTAVRVNREAGISNTSVDSALESVSGGWESAGYASARDRYTITLKSGVSDLKVEVR